mgnify:CR=1 FL=1
MEDVGGYRLIWFQHLHKAAGTLIVNMAKANNEVLHNPHNNGNPSDIKGSTLPLWEYDESRLLDFINNFLNLLFSFFTCYFCAIC